MLGGVSSAGSAIFNCVYKANMRHLLYKVEYCVFIVCSTHMPRCNKLSEINFFESPHPFHFTLHPNLDLEEIHHPSSLLFNNHHFNPHPSPIHPQQQLAQIDQPGPEQFSNQLHNGLMMEPLNNSLCMDEEIAIKRVCIDQKIDFSKEEEQEDLLIGLTPKKECIFPSDNTQEQTTIRKANQINELRFCERGLKKLAYEAYLFVIAQKRTSYKDVARQLMLQMAQQTSPEIEKKGELNIKRRVYDALNVLIAVGLLRRTGNKILAKKVENHLATYNCTTEHPNTFKDLELYQELMQVRSQLADKQACLLAKQQRVKSLQQQIAALSEICHRNKTTKNKQAHQIPMPFFGLGSQTKQDTELQESGEVSIWQQNGIVLYRGEALRSQLMGDLDLLEYYNKDRKELKQKPKKQSNKSV